MGWLSWFTRSNGNARRRTEQWRQSWADAVAAPDAARTRDLRSQLTAIAATAPTADEDHEIEIEMQEGLEALVELSAATEQNGPPVIATGHRAAGNDPCHFSAPASLPDDPAQPAGTLLLTSTRLIFVGGARAVTIPWHAVGKCMQQGRDVLVMRVDRQDLQRVRCNTFSDTLCAAYLARHLSGRRQV
jgi:hypothetical protein